ncbi:hypothetical protein CCHOA_07900 [Corynebacterium choanae]|uniref:Uncharacterized protein n=1 Tax=Corynebacterium choanae TaxID=1862358 RepID=A0A3G6J838_9CORY|nr:hypothetical protein CCHOA_07900 [Corynebacterium choanae]
MQNVSLVTFSAGLSQCITVFPLVTLVSHPGYENMTANRLLPLEHTHLIPYSAHLPAASAHQTLGSTLPRTNDNNKTPKTTDIILGYTHVIEGGTRDQVYSPTVLQKSPLLLKQAIVVTARLSYQSTRGAQHPTP